MPGVRRCSRNCWRHGRKTDVDEQGMLAAGCHCGAVRFRVPEVPQMQLLCFCSDCQLISGSQNYAPYIVPLTTVQLLQGQPVAYSVRSDQGRRNTRHFCGRCGARLWAELEIGLASVNGMCLDDRSHFTPDHNHRAHNAPAWCQIDSALAELPSG